MTNTITRTRIPHKLRSEIISFCLLLVAVGFGLMLSGEAAEYVKDGMRLAANCVIPSSFPFMIISDLYSAYGRPENLRLLGAAVSKLLGIPPAGLGAFICGNIGGFPIGAKMCSDLYESGMLSKEEAERLIPLCNNPSSAFVIGGVGIGMCGNARIGFALLASIVISTVLCGMITKHKTQNDRIFDNKLEQSYNFIASVKKSGTSCIGIFSFICIFSVALGILKKRVKYAPILYVILSVSEVTNAVSTLTTAGIFPPEIRLAWCSFSLGFGGLCVGMQSAYFASSAGLSMKKYYAIKLLEGLLSASISPLAYRFFNTIF